jgi:hypothetical protein
MLIRRRTAIHFCALLASLVNLSAGTLYTQVSGFTNDLIVGTHSCTDVGTNTAGCNPGGYAASSESQAFASAEPNFAGDNVHLTLGAVGNTSLGTLVTNGVATAEGWASSAHTFTVGGYSGPGSLSIAASVAVDLFGLVVGSCSGTVNLTIGASSGTWSACVSGIYNETAAAPFGAPVDFSLSLHAISDSAGGTPFSNGSGGIQYTSSVNVFASANAPFQLLFQPLYWYEPLPQLSVTEQGVGDVTFLFEQKNLQASITPEPRTAVLGGSSILLWAMSAYRKRKRSRARCLGMTPFWYK